MPIGEMTSIIGLAAGKVLVAPYSVEWQRLFAEERSRLLAAVGAYVQDVQHVGSTSIPGMAAKPIIDIGIAVRNFEEASVCVGPIEHLGYEYRGENGIPRRRYFERGNPRSYHLHMNEMGEPDTLSGLSHPACGDRSGVRDDQDVIGPGVSV
jgi:GrpB-like predicted nucleotidyltransferase (UPF0157 family)